MRDAHLIKESGTVFVVSLCSEHYWYECSEMASSWLFVQLAKSVLFIFFLVEYQTIILVHGGGGGGGGINPGGISTVSISTFYPHHRHKSCLALLSS
jgi:hypothetical protein